ncbi:trehalase [Crotalus adamanteus]|uniref:Trehalase n=1 Tax=Crotalus adamanteus TaxID=8729 RepID=A0AAW1AYW8_CROAD
MLDPVGRGFLVICAALWWWQVMAGSLPPPCDRERELGSFALCSVPGPDVGEGMEFAAQKMLGVWGLVLGSLAVGIKEQLSPTLQTASYCTGELLQQVQLARLFQDDKDFVDMPLKSNPGQDLESWIPPDWTDSIPLKRISDEKLRSWAQVLNAKWKQLGRRVSAKAQPLGDAEGGYRALSRSCSISLQNTWIPFNLSPLPPTRPESYMKDIELAVGLEESNCLIRLLDPRNGKQPASCLQLLWAMLEAAASCFITCFPAEAQQGLWAELQRDGEKASWFWAARRQRVAAVTAVLWNEDAGVLVHNRAFYPSKLSPLWTECGMDLPRTEKALHYLEESSALSYTNGLPTSLTQMGQQWDLPNAWAPVQHMVILGLAKSSSPRARELAFSLAQCWLQMNLAVFEKYGGMFEKYDVEGDGKPGGGGEYPVQEGFGWTNGVALQLLDLYGEQLTAASSLCSPSWPWIGACLILVLFSQLPGLLGDGPVQWEG